MEQVEFWLKNPFEKGEFQNNHVLFKDDKGYLETVSYTHLDVYKRQAESPLRL